MPSRNVLIGYLLCFLVLASAMPQENNNDDGSLFGLPFIQFKNGGVRVNFAGFHAQAGLGGLLDPSNAGGGLHASAGTPWGANAAAGLGGLLGGADGTAGGGLYARAGLGDGLPEAGAGLGGMLNGRSNTPASGGLFAGATMGRRSGGSSPNDSGSNGNKGNGNGGSGKEENGNGANMGTEKKSHTNIQVITRPRRGEEKEKEAQQQKELVKIPMDQSLGKKTEQHFAGGLGAHAGLYGSIHVDPASGETTKEILKSAEGIKISTGPVDMIKEISQAPPVPEINLIDPNTLPQRKHGFGRWNLRRRLRGKKKTIQATQEVENESEDPNRRVTRDAEDPPPSYEEVMAEDQRKPKEDTVFDDIFNIPTSSLNAVNRLLNNHAG